MTGSLRKIVLLEGFDSTKQKYFQDGCTEIRFFKGFSRMKSTF